VLGDLLWAPEPFGVLFVLLIFSPSTPCGNFRAWAVPFAGFHPALVYIALLIPSIALSLVLIGFSALAGARETWQQ
jgi:hypothetical protein